MLRFVAGNAQHIGAREEQQDSFAFSNMGDEAFASHGGLLGVLADGMGGLEAGQQASSVAVETFLAAYQSKPRSETIPEALHRSLEEANRAVVAAARQAGAEGNSGTTIAAAVVHDDSLYWVSVGDSRVYLMRDGKLARVNADHTYATTLWVEVAAGTRERESALRDPQASHLTSHLGMEEVVQLDMSQRPFPLLPNDAVIVCSDGIYRSVNDEEMIAAFRSASPAQACEAIRDIVLAKGHSKQDNLTIIAIQCLGAATSSSASISTSGKKRPWSPFFVGAACLELAIAAGLGYQYARTYEKHPETLSPAVRPGKTSAPAVTAAPSMPVAKPAPGRADSAAPQQAGAQPGAQSEIDHDTMTSSPQSRTKPSDPRSTPQYTTEPAAANEVFPDLLLQPTPATPEATPDPTMPPGATPN
jgi:protein phosphatase